MDIKELKLVNWIEGMDVSDKHLVQLEDYFIGSMADNRSIALTTYNYGLLPSPDGRGVSSEFEISETVTGKVEIRLMRCNALTAGGSRIAFNPGKTGYLIYTHSFEATENRIKNEVEYWDVILTVDPFKRIPCGIPDDEATPPRHPDVSEEYRLSISPSGKIDKDQLGFYHLVIGRIRQKTGRFEVDTNFIPPCSKMNSHEELLHYYQRFGIYMNDIERASKVIIAKIRNRSENSPMAEHICSICEDIMRYIGSIYFTYRNQGRELAPVEIVNYFSTLAHICFNSLNFINKTEKEELLKYFYEWSDVTPGSFDDLLATTLAIIYEHNSIRNVMVQVESFLGTFSELWLKLSTLEYIGQHKENIVVSERFYQKETVKSKSGWTILD